MPCRSCRSSDDLEVCLFCGHSFCAIHRGESGGVACCTGCLKAERARKGSAKARHAPAAAGPEAGPEPPPASQPEPSAPLPEPVGWGPVLWGLVAAALTVVYLYCFLGWLVDRHELPLWVRTAGSWLGAGAAFLGVWAIVKSRGR